jgi:hypothetical protein
MRIHARLSSAIMSAALVLVPFIASASDQQLLLKHGIYVRGISCRDAANAEILSWDGIGFSGAHSSKCTSRVLHREGTRFQVKTTCSAIGDGPPNLAASDHVDSFSLNRLSGTRFELVKENQSKATFRWCSVANATS